MNQFNTHIARLSTLALASLLCCGAAQAQSTNAQVEQLRATTQALIDTLVESGVLSRDAAAKLLQQASARAQAAAPLAVDKPEVGADGKRIVRVPYVPEAVRNQMREEIKTEVLAQAKQERWGQPDAYPDWVKRISFEGDARVRYEAGLLAGDNTPAGFGFQSGDNTRAADLAYNTGSTGLKTPNGNTQDDFQRTRIRTRLGVKAQVSDDVEAGVRLSTGSSTGSPTSTNQTMGQSFNKYAVVFDRAYVKFEPATSTRLSAGRMANPFFSTDLVYADDLGFEGFAGTVSQKLGAGKGWATLGYFPMSEDKPGSSRSRSLVGLQVGGDFKLGGLVEDVKLGLAYYGYNGITGSKETQADQSQPDYATRYEYSSAMRQRGNTLFRVNSPLDTGNTLGLASEFRILNLTAAASFKSLLPQPLNLSADLVKNLGFDRQQIQQRTGTALSDGKDTGYQLKVVYGPQQVARQGQWSASLAYRFLGSDAVLDAYTSSDFGFGGTNNKGWILGANYGLRDNTWVSARWLSANQIDSFAPGKSTSTKLSADTLQLDLNVRF